MGFIGKDRTDEDAVTWFPTAPIAVEEEQQDKTTTHDIYWNAEGIACCTGAEGE
jgi:hypothetical protein